MQTLPGSYALTGTENGVGLFDLSQIVGKDNIGSITAVKGASYDKGAGIARYSAAVEKPSYTYATSAARVSLTDSFSLDMSTHCPSLRLRMSSPAAGTSTQRSMPAATT
ncbi:MAG: hypothetical protein ACLSHG_10050 [Oscillospiraceae bacterium]